MLQLAKGFQRLVAHCGSSCYTELGTCGYFNFDVTNLPFFACFLEEFD